MYARVPNFYRPVVALLGLPFDVISLRDATRRLEQARLRNERCFLSLPNLRFALQSEHDPAFRASVCRSDLSVADGLPLVWVARLLGLPLTGRVSGNSLVESLRRSRNRPWSVFFFGGPQGAGQQACLELGKSEEFFPVGHLFAGPASTEALSDPQWLDCINAAKPDLLVVALGAVQGQSWISANLSRLQTPVVGYLEAVITRSTGPGWVWRAKEKLWLPCLKDSWALLRLLVGNVLPLALHSLYCRWQMAHDARQERGSVLRPALRVNEMRLSGVCAGEQLLPVRRAFTSAWNSGKDVVLDASDLQGFDAGFVALLLILDTALRDADRQLSLSGFSVKLQRQLRWHGAAHLLARSS